MELFRGQVFSFDEKLGQGAQGAVYAGLWHCMEAAFKATEAAADENDDDENNAMSAMKNVNKMKSKMSEVNPNAYSFTIKMSCKFIVLLHHNGYIDYCNLVFSDIL